MTVLRRFDCILSDTNEEVVSKNIELQNMPEIRRASVLKTISGYEFYNISKFDFEKLLADPDNIESNFRNYINGFSANVLGIIKSFNFDGT